MATNTNPFISDDGTTPIYQLRSNISPRSMKFIRENYGTEAYPMFNWAHLVKTGQRTYDPGDESDRRRRRAYERATALRGEVPGMEMSSIFSAAVPAVAAVAGQHLFKAFQDDALKGKEPWEKITRGLKSAVGYENLPSDTLAKSRALQIAALQKAVPRKGFVAIPGLQNKASAEAAGLSDLYRSIHEQKYDKNSPLYIKHGDAFLYDPKALAENTNVTDFTIDAKGNIYGSEPIWKESYGVDLTGDVGGSLDEWQQPETINFSMEGAPLAPQHVKDGPRALLSEAEFNRMTPEELHLFDVNTSTDGLMSLTESGIEDRGDYGELYSELISDVGEPGYAPGPSLEPGETVDFNVYKDIRDPINLTTKELDTSQMGSPLEVVTEGSDTGIGWNDQFKMAGIGAVTGFGVGLLMGKDPVKAAVSAGAGAIGSMLLGNMFGPIGGVLGGTLGSALGGRVICNELHRQGFLERRQVILDYKFTREHLTPKHVKGYHVWATHVVRKLREGKQISLWRHIAIHRAREIEYIYGERDKPDYLGKIYRHIGEPICWVLGNFCKETDWSVLYQPKEI